MPSPSLHSSARSSNSVKITEHLKAQNELVIVFASAFIHGKILEEQHLGPGKHSALWNGDPSRLFVRKAGYNCELAGWLSWNRADLSLCRRLGLGARLDDGWPLETHPHRGFPGADR